MSNEFSDAFTELLDANDEVCGKEQFVLIDGKKHRAIIAEVPSEVVMLAGGRAEAGQFTVQVAVSGFSEPPEKGDAVEVRGQEYEIIGEVTNANNAVYTITVGDPNAK